MLMKWTMNADSVASRDYDWLRGTWVEWVAGLGCYEKIVSWLRRPDHCLAVVASDLRYFRPIYCPRHLY